MHIVWHSSGTLWDRLQTFLCQVRVRTFLKFTAVLHNGWLAYWFDQSIIDLKPGDISVISSWDLLS